MITGKDLIEAGYQPGKWFTAAIETANARFANGASREEAIASISDLAPPPVIPLDGIDSSPLYMNIDADGPQEQANVVAVHDSMRELLRTPVVKAGALMPDACPTGSTGTIPVGGVAVSEAIHPGMHSADICCSMAITNFGSADAGRILDAVHSVTHFGPTQREAEVHLPDHLAAAIDGNAMLRNQLPIARQHFATQGDGNHFAYVGHLKSSGDTVLVTHHGSRGLGARLYKAGMTVAERYRLALSPETLKANASIPADSKDGEVYWAALQIVREWTKANHFAIHDMTSRVADAVTQDRFWNEHNFVFRKSDGLFYHAKGATPAFDGWASDATDYTIIPLNMGEPILIVRGSNSENGLGFSPHGAGRNMSRTAHKRRIGDRADAEVFAEETSHIDARFFCGRIDVSELPSAYKNADAVRAQIGRYGLAEIVDEVLPYGTIMAGDWEYDAPWRRAKRAAGKQ